MATGAKKKKPVRKIYWIIAAVVLVIILVAIQKCNGGKDLVVDVQHPERKTIVENIPANGKIQPVTEVKIAPDVSGEIVELHVKEGDFVKKGDLIIKIKQDTYISAVERAEASLNSTRAAFKQQEAQSLRTQQNYERNKKLYELRTISQAEYETAQAEWDIAQQQLVAARYNINSAEAALKEARENLVKTTIYSPMDGIVSKLGVELGERVVGTTQMAGTEMFRVANFDQLEVLVDVNENDIIRLVAGDSAVISVDAYPDRKFFGYVTEVANSSKSATSTLDQATTYEVKVRISPESYADIITEKSNPFRPGMSASVQIETSKAQNVITVPLASVTTRKELQANPEETQQMVFVYDSGTSTVSAKSVKTGLQDLSSIQVTDGLTDSTYIVTAPYAAISKDLKEGTKVKARIK